MAFEPKVSSIKVDILFKLVYFDLNGLITVGRSLSIIMARDISSQAVGIEDMMTLTLDESDYLNPLKLITP